MTYKVEIEGIKWDATKKEKIENKSNSLISDEEKERRAKNKALKAQGVKGGEINHQIDDVNCCM